MPVNTNDLSRKRVFLHRPKKNDPDNIKKAGRIHAFVFHPAKPRLLGFLVKRPDIALMFHRSDMFVAFDGFEETDGYLVVKEAGDVQGKSAEKSLAKSDGIKLDDCVIWVGLPVIAETGEILGSVDNVEFDPSTGNVISVETTQGATANTLLGRRRIPARLVRGFKRGQGARLRDEGYEGEEDSSALGCLMVSAEAAAIEVEGGVAEKAGEATAIAADKAKRAGKKMADKASEVASKVEPKAKATSKTVGAAVQKGAYATGRQIARTEGMFSNFKKELQRAMKDEDDA